MKNYLDVDQVLRAQATEARVGEAMKKTELATNRRTGQRFTRCVPSGKVRFESMQSAERMMAQMVLDRSEVRPLPCLSVRRVRRLASHVPASGQTVLMIR